MANLICTDTSLQIVGDGPITTTFTAEMIRRLLKLPSHPDLIWHGEPTITAFDILSRLDKAAAASITSILKWEPKLREDYEHKEKHFAAFAHPTTGVWPDDSLMVLETILVDLPFMLFVSWRMDGSIRIGMTGSRIDTMTAEEFQAAMGKTYREYCELHLPLYIERSKRALALLAIETPKKSVVSFINKNSAFEKKTMVYWQDDQIDMYLNRNELSHISTEPEDN